MRQMRKVNFKERNILMIWTLYQFIRNLKEKCNDYKLSSLIKHLNYNDKPKI